MDADKISFDQIQLALDIADKDWYREAADRASIPSTSLRTRAQVRADVKLARGGNLYKPSQDHKWRAAIATQPIKVQQGIKNERKESKASEAHGSFGGLRAHERHVADYGARCRDGYAST